MKKILFFLACCFLSIQAKKTNFIESISVKKNKISYKVNKIFKDRYLVEDLYVTYQEDIDLTGLDYSILTLPLLLNTISMIWVSGNTYYIEEMDQALYHGLEIVHEVFRRFYPKTKWDGQLIPNKLVDNTNLAQKLTTPGIALPFSHGLDSLCTSLRYLGTPQFLMTVRGMPDIPMNSWNENWEITKATINNFARTYGHNNTYVASNFHTFFNWDTLCSISPEITNWRCDAVEDLGWIGIAAPLLIIKGINKLVVAGNPDWSSPHPGASCPLINDVISFAGISVTTDAFDLVRPKKNKEIAVICNKHNLEKPWVMVCTQKQAGRKNCCYCQKCVITILSFLLIGQDPKDYGFDINIRHFLYYFKDRFFYRQLFGGSRSCWYKYCQVEARKNLDTFDPELQRFFGWYINIDFDKLLKPTARITINYDNFKDIYNGIPDDWQKAREELVQNVPAGTLTIYDREIEMNNPQGE